jgi:hypothetical protein
LPYAEIVTIEIKTPALEALISERLKTGDFHHVDELLRKALEALPHNSPEKPRPNLAAFLLKSPFAGRADRSTFSMDSSQLPLLSTSSPWSLAT